jgi:Mycoplasma protein of unknown function, DUF285
MLLFVEMRCMAISLRGIGTDQWHVHSIVTMRRMFSRTSLPDAKMSLWNTSRESHMAGMFMVLSLQLICLETWEVSIVNKACFPVFHLQFGAMPGNLYGRDVP